MLNSAHKIPTVFFFSTPFAMQKKEQYANYGFTKRERRRENTEQM